jgi:predicted Rdx family selenoprotein
LTHYEQVIERLTLVPADGGRFEVRVDKELIFSKRDSKRHVEPGEIVRLLQERAAHLEATLRSGY